MAYIKGRNVRVEIGKTEGLAIEVTGISKAKPGVLTSVAHGLNNGAVGYLVSVEGMVMLEGQAVRVSEKTADTFKLQGIDTTLFPDFTGTAQFIPVTAWSTVSPATSYVIGGGDADKIDVTVLLDSIKQEENGLLAAQTVTFDMNAEEVPGEAMVIMEDAAFSQASLVYRITLSGNVAQRIWRGQPSLPGENVQVGQKGTGNFGSTVKGRVLKLAGVA